MIQPQLTLPATPDQIAELLRVPIAELHPERCAPLAREALVAARSGQRSASSRGWRRSGARIVG